MMKKLLSIILSVCMLFSMVVIPAIAEEAQADGGLTHGYYKWDFSEDTLYTDYANPVKASGNTYDFAAKSAGVAEIGYGQLGGKDALYLKTTGNNNAVVTPLKADGTPFVLEAGKQYTLNIEYYTTRGAGAWCREYLEPYARTNMTVTNGSNPRYAAYYTAEDETQVMLTYDGAASPYPGFTGLYAGTQMRYWNDGAAMISSTDKVVLDAYTKATADGVNTFTLRSDVQYDNGVSATGTLRTISKTLTMLSDEELKAYNVTKNDDGSYTFNGATYSSYFSFSLPGAYGSNYYPGYDEKSSENLQDAEGNWYHKGYGEYYITGITIAEAGVGSVNYHVGDEVTSVVGKPGDAVDLTPPAAPEGKYFVNWYTDAELTAPLTAAQTIAEGAPLELYARFADYGTSAREDFDTNPSGKTAVQYGKGTYSGTAYEGFYFPVTGYSIKTGYSTQVDASRTPAWTADELKNDFKRNYGEDYNLTFPTGVGTFSCDRTWGMPGPVMLRNEDGTMFIAEPNARYKLTIRYRMPLYNGNTITITPSYGMSVFYANKTSTTDQNIFYQRGDAISAKQVNTEWTVVENIIDTEQLSTDYIPAIGYYISCPTKKAIDTNEDGENDTYAYSLIEVDYITVEKIPAATVTYKDNAGNTTSTKTYEVGADIEYSTLPASLNYDYVWSLSNTEYIPVPATVTEEKDITVYAYQNPVLSFENYPVSNEGSANPLYNAALPYDNELMTQVTDKVAYTGTHSMKLRNYYLQYVEAQPEDWETNWKAYWVYDEANDIWVHPDDATAPVHETWPTTKYAIWRNSAETGMTVIHKYSHTENPLTFSYKVTFKYMATEKNKAASSLNARVFCNDNLWWGNTAITGTFNFPAGATDGWVTGEMYVAANGVVIGTNTGKQHVLDLQWKGNGVHCSSEIYIDDITIEENFVNTPTVYQHVGDQVTAVTSGVTAGGTYTLPASVEAPAGKYFMGWADAAGNIVTSVTIPAATMLCEVHVYAQFGAYPDNVTYDTTGATQPTLKGYSTFTSSTLNETGWARKSYTAEGIKFQKALGGANKWDPTKETSGTHGQTGASTDLVALANDLPVGTQTTGGWSATANYVLRDKDGNAVMAKPNTKYAVVVTYEKMFDGPQYLAVGMGRKVDWLTTGANDKAHSTYNRFYSSTHDLNSEEITGENDTHTFYVTTGNFTEGDVPVISLHYGSSAFIVERVAADENGVESYVYNQDGKTYYPYKIISTPEVIVKEVKLIEVEAGNTAVTYKGYEEGVGFNAEIKDAAPGTALESTKNVDWHWYTRKEANQFSDITTYPAKDTILFNADYMQAHVREITSPNTAAFYFGDGLTAKEEELTFKSVEVDGKYALNFSSDVAVGYNDVQVLRLDDVQDGHTYKFTASFKADEMNTDLQLILATAQDVNVWGVRNSAATIVMKSEAVTKGEWTTVTYYFSVDPLGKVTDTEETGVDYNTNASYYSTLYLHFVQSAALNTVYVADIEVKDLGAVVATGGASILTDEAAQEAGSQAMRYYFSYETTDGSDIILDGETFQVKERGFIYRNGALAKDAQEAAFVVSTTGVKRTAKTENFNSCWKYENRAMTFSTYVTGFAIGDTTMKLQVKAYLIVENAAGDRYYLYSNSINRTVAGVGAGTDTDINIGK